MHSFSTYNDEQLVSLLQQDEEPAFAEIYNRYWKSLYTSAVTILQVKTAAEDAVQEVFISLWRRRHEVQIESLKSYLYQAVRFQVFKAIRAEKADRDFFNRLSLVSRQLVTDDPLLFKELEGIYKITLSSLPEDEKEIFRLHREAGMTYQQIADAKGISIKTVEKKMSQALRQLRQGMDKTLLLAILGYMCK